jgi:hypothetical protein
MVVANSIFFFFQTTNQKPLGWINQLDLTISDHGHSNYLFIWVMMNQSDWLGSFEQLG